MNPRSRPGAAGRRRHRLRTVLLALLAAAGVVTAASAVYNAAVPLPGTPTGLRFVQAGDVSTRFLQWGDHGPPVVLVPGGFETADSFRELGAALGADHRVFALDLTGQGYSEAVPPFDVDHDVAQTLAFARALGLTGPDAPVLVGHSAGAAIVGLAAVRDPAAVAGVVFLDGDALPLDAPPWVSRLVVEPYRTSLVRLALRSDRLVRRVYAGACGPTCAPLDAAGVERWTRPLLQPGTQRALRANAARGIIPAMTGEQLEALRRSDVPRLVVWGADDRAYAAGAPEGTARSIGAPPPVLVPGGHLSMIASPQAVADAVAAFAAR